jgi:hypothetical protein
MIKTQAVQARALLNWAKELLVSQLVSPADTLAEIYCDSGAPDLGKYLRAGVGHYVPIDTSGESLSRTREAVRQRGDPFRTTAVQADPAGPEFRDAFTRAAGTPTVSHVVCFTGLHQPGRMTSEHHASQLLRNVHASLQPGGFFFGLVSDSATIWSRTQGSDLDRKKGDLYTVSCSPTHAAEECGDRGRQFGSMAFQLQIAGETEATGGHLVHFPSLQRLADEVGFRVCEIINALEFFTMYKGHYRKQLIAHQVLSDKCPKLEKPDADVAAFFALFVLQKKRPAELAAERSQRGIVKADDFEPDPPQYHFAVSTSRRPPAARGPR